MLFASVGMVMGSHVGVAGISKNALLEIPTAGVGFSEQAGFAFGADGGEFAEPGYGDGESGAAAPIVIGTLASG